MKVLNFLFFLLCGAIGLSLASASNSVSYAQTATPTPAPTTGFQFSLVYPSDGALMPGQPQTIQAAVSVSPPQANPLGKHRVLIQLRDSKSRAIRTHRYRVAESPFAVQLNLPKKLRPGTYSLGATLMYAGKKIASAGPLTVVKISSDTDIYGGTTKVQCSKGSQPHFYTEKVGDRWWLCDPAGNGFFMKGLVGVYPGVNIEQKNIDIPGEACTASGSPAPCCTGAGTGPTCGGKYYTGVNNPYVDAAAQDPANVWFFNWIIEQLDRLRLWGFNMLADAAHSNLWPTATDPRWNTSDNAIPAQFRMPFEVTKNTTFYALTNRAGCNLSSPIKDMKNGLTAANQSVAFHSFADYFDPNYVTCVNGQANPANDAALKAATQNTHNDYLVYITLDNGDQTGFLLQGPDFQGVGDAGLPNGPVGATHVGWVTLATSPTQNSNTKWNATYSDHEVYSKVHLANQLANEYLCTGSGTPLACCSGSLTGTCSVDPASSSYIGPSNMTAVTGALNSAWGSRYTTIATSDPNCVTNLSVCLQNGSYASWGTGTGLLDENGFCPAAPGGSCWIGDARTLVGATAGMQADMSAYLTSYSDAYFATLTNAFHTYEPGILLQMLVGGWGAPPRKEVLREAGKYLTLPQLGVPPYCPTCTDIQQRINFTVQYLGDKPWMMWEGFFANPDSSESQHVETSNIASTQAGRGAAYQQMVSNLISAKDSGGTYHVVGFYWWDEFDMNSEGLNWGLVSIFDNPYDGCSATIAGCGNDQWGYSTGGEAANYGDVLTNVTNTNKNAIANMPP